MGVLALAMLGLAFASVPLYRAFCQLTGFDGTPLRAERAPGAVAGQIGVRFDASCFPGFYRGRYNGGSFGPCWSWTPIGPAWNCG